MDILTTDARSILDRLKSLFLLDYDKELAGRLKVYPTAVNQALRKKVPIDWLLRARAETGVSLDALIYGPPPRRLLPESSNSTYLSEKIIAAVPEIMEMIEVRACDHLRERKITPIIVWRDFHAEYIAESELNEDRPQRAQEVQAIRDACLAAGARVSWIDGSLSYANYGRKTALHEGLILAQGLGQNVLRELGSYCHSTGRRVSAIKASGEQSRDTTAHIPADVLNALKDPELIGMIRGFLLGKASRTASDE